MHTFISLLVAWGPRQVSMTHAYSINVQPIINMHMHQAQPPPLLLSAIPLLSTTKIPLTLLKVVGFAHIHTDQGHQLQLRQSLSRWLRQRQQIPQIGDLSIYEIPSHLRGALRRFVGIKSARAQGNHSTKLANALKNKKKHVKQLEYRRARSQL